MLPIPVQSLPESSHRPLHRERWLRLVVCLPLLVGFLGVLTSEEGTRHWLRAVFLQDGAASYALSERARDGLGQPADSARARVWLFRAAHQGEPRARVEIGREAYARAEEAADPRERERLLREAAELGDPRALWALGTEARDVAQGYRWIQEAAARGNCDALLRIADWTEDPALAADLYRRAVRAARLDGREGRWVDGLWVGEASSDALNEHLTRYPAQRRPEDAVLAVPARVSTNNEEYQR